MTDADLAAMEAEASALPGETWGVAFPIGYITDDPAVRLFIAASRTRVPALVAELRRLRGLLRDYANACDAIDATVGIEAPETWEPAQRAFDAARDALYAEGKR